MTCIHLAQQKTRPQGQSRAPSLSNRIVQMMAAWLVLGTLVGAGNSLLIGGEATMIFANTLAGMVLFPLIGLALSMIGGRAKESLFGGAAGAIFGLAVGTIAGPENSLETANHALVVGALAGATLRPYLILTRRIFAGLQVVAAYMVKLAAALDGQRRAVNGVEAEVEGSHL